MLQLAEVFYSVQGEGTYTGTPAVFVRLAGCNLACKFCDTDFSLRSIDSVTDVVKQVQSLANDCPMVIITGGEPTIQKDFIPLVEALRNNGRCVHIESNGATEVTLADDVWLTVSPKQRLNHSMAKRANEVKLIVDGRIPSEWLDYFPQDTPIFLQPEGNKNSNIMLSVDAVMAHPKRYRLSLQIHKFIGVR